MIIENQKSKNLLGTLSPAQLLFAFQSKIQNPKSKIDSHFRHITIILVLILTLVSHVSIAAEPPKESEADLLFEFAEKLYNVQVYKTAAAEYRRFLNDFPDEPRREEVRYKLAMCLIQTKELDKALGELVALRREIPNGKRIQDCLFYSGHIKYMQGDAQGAIEDLSQLGKLNVRPDLAVQTNHFLGRASYDLGKFADAAKYLALVAQAPKEQKLRPFALFLLADSQLQLKENKSAADSLELLIRDYPQFPVRDEVWLKLSSIRILLREYDKALDAASQVSKDGEFRERAEVSKLYAILGQKKYKDCIAAGEALIQNTKDKETLSQAHYVIGLALFEQESWAEAAEAFTKVLASVQQGSFAESSALKLCWSYYKLGPDQAKKLVASCLDFRRLFPSSEHGAQILFLTAEGYLNVGPDYDNAISFYRQIPESSPYHPDALYRIAFCLHKQKKAEDAARAYDAYAEKYQKHDSTDDALFASAGIYQAAGKFDEAIKRYSQYVTKNAPQAEEAIYQLGVCQAKLSKFDEMAATFRTYAEKYPQGRNAGPAFRWIGRYHRAKADALDLAGNYTAAITEYSNAEAALLAAMTAGGVEKDDSALAYAECTSKASILVDAQAAKAVVEGKADEAEKLTKKAQELAANSAAIFNQLIMQKPEIVKQEFYYFWSAAWHRENKKPEIGIKILETFVGQFRTSEHLELALYQLALMNGELEKPDHDSLVKHCDNLIQRFPSGGYALQAKLLKAVALLKKNPSDQGAEKLLIEVARLAPDDVKVNATMRLGHLNLAKQDLPSAIRYFAEVGLLFDDKNISAEALFQAGYTSLLLKDQVEARKFWKELLARYPDAEWSVRAKRELESIGYTVDKDGTIRKKN